MAVRQKVCVTSFFLSLPSLSLSPSRSSHVLSRVVGWTATEGFDIQPLNGMGEDDGRPMAEESTSVFLLPEPNTQCRVLKEGGAEAVVEVKEYTLPTHTVTMKAVKGGKRKATKKTAESNAKKKPKKKDEEKTQKKKTKKKKPKAKKEQPKAKKEQQVQKKQPLDKGSSTTESDAAPSPFSLATVVQSFKDPRGPYMTDHISSPTYD